MNKIFFALTAIALLFGSAMILMSEAPTAENFSMFEQFKSKFNKEYSSPEEEMYRNQVFFENLQWINENNVDGTFGVTIMMDLTREEFASTYLTLNVPMHLGNAEVVQSLTQPDAAVDWAANVPAVLNQGSCGSCWAFSAAGTISCAFNIKQGGNSVQASAGQITQCSTNGNFGCNGGWMDYAFEYAKTKPIATTADYPYTSGGGTTGACNKAQEAKGVYKVASYTGIPAGNVDAMYTALQGRPLAIAADASNWSFYATGVFSNCGKSLNHGIVMTGYNPNGGNGYWNVKNSWGTAWGQSGYIWLKWGDTCGCSQATSYVNV